MKTALSVMRADMQGGLFEEFPVTAGGRRPLGRKIGFPYGGITAAVRMAVFSLCLGGKSITTDSTGFPQGRVRSAFRVLERARLLKIGRRPCRNPHGYRLVARLHPRLRHLRAASRAEDACNGLEATARLSTVAKGRQGIS